MANEKKVRAVKHHSKLAIAKFKKQALARLYTTARIKDFSAEDFDMAFDYIIGQLTASQNPESDHANLLAEIDAELQGLLNT